MKNFLLIGFSSLLFFLVCCHKEPPGSDEGKNIITFMDTLGRYYMDSDPPFYPTSADFDVDADGIDDVTITSYSSYFSYVSGFNSWQTVTPLNNAFVGYMIGLDTTWVYCEMPLSWDTCWYYNSFNLVRHFDNFDTIHEMGHLSNELVYISDFRYRGTKPESGHQRLAFNGIGYLVIQTQKTTAWLKIEVLSSNYLVVHKCRYNLPPGCIILDILWF